MPLHPHRIVGEEGGAGAATFEASDDARGARVEHGDAHIGGDALHRVPQLPIGDALAPQHQANLVGVAGVVEDQLRPKVSLPRLADTIPEPRERTEEGPGCWVLQDQAVVRRDAAEAGEYLREAFRVREGVSEGRPIRIAPIRASHEGEPTHLGGSRGRWNDSQPEQQRRPA